MASYIQRQQIPEVPESVYQAVNLSQRNLEESVYTIPSSTTEHYR